MKYKIGFIGGGNMASAIINGLLKSNLYQAADIITSVQTEASVKRLQDAFGICVTKDNGLIFESSDLIIIAVKPHMVESILTANHQHLRPEHTIVSIAAGITLKQLIQWAGTQRCIRAMPNTPASIGQGMTSICSQLPQEDSVFSTLIEIFNAIGKTIVIEERLIHAAIALHGSSPAYAYLMLEAMGDAGVKLGMKRELAYEMAAMALKGAADMYLHTKEHPGVLKDQVTSPGGTTIEAVAELEKRGFRSALIEAMTSCALKSEKMSND